MNLKLLNKQENKITFLVKGINASLVNAVRRSIMEEVPVMAIEEVTFVKNTSASIPFSFIFLKYFSAIFQV